MIDNNNIELYIFQFKEGLLTSEETEAVKQALKANPQWATLAEDYDPALQLPKAKALPYPNKQRLHQIAQPIIIANTDKTIRAIPMWRRIAVAACLLLAIGLGVRLLWPKTDSTQKALIAKSNIDTMSKQKEQPQETQSIETPVRPVVINNKQILLTETEVPDPEVPITAPCEETFKTVISNKLITYLDDDATLAENKPAIVQTDKMIIYIEETDLLENSKENEAKPDWIYAYQDMRNSMELMYTEQRTNLINRYLAMRER